MPQEGVLRFPENAYLDIYIDDEMEEVCITGTAQGLNSLIECLAVLRDSDDTLGHFHLNSDEGLVVPNSADLTLFKENPAWFTGDSDESPENWEVDKRNIDPASIYALQFICAAPEGLPLTPQKLYRVIRVEGTDGDGVLKECLGGNPERYHCFVIIDDNGNQLSNELHLDDPDVNYFTHREIMGLAIAACQ